MNIIVDKDIPFIRGRLEPFGTVTYVDGKQITSEMTRDVEVLIIRTRTKCDESLLRGSKVKLICTATIGTDHIDLEWCRKNGISVTSSPGCNAPGVAQYLFASIFKCGFNPKKDILGIIGHGNVGSIVARWANAMEIETLICDPIKEQAGFKDADYCSLNFLLKNSDTVTLHVPLTFSGPYPTYRLIGKKELNALKKNALIVNSSRGGVVDEKCLLNYLIEKKLRAVIDVWENEPEINTHLLQMADIATPHIAGYSLEGKKRATRMVLENFERFFKVSVDKSGLDSPVNDKKPTPDLIMNSYDPVADTRLLKKDWERFEFLRNNYAYRHEPSCMI